MERLTTDDPQGNYQRLHNMTAIKDMEVFLKLGDAEINLVDYCKSECKEKCGIEFDGDAQTFGDYMDCDCIVAIFYGMAIGHAEMRAHLKEYEDSNLTPTDIKKLARAIARNLVAWDTSKDKKEGLLPEVYLTDRCLYKKLTGVEYNFSDACKRFNIGD